MDLTELMTAALGATAAASVVYAGMAINGRKNLTSLDIDMVTLAFVVIFISMLVAKHPEWIS